MKNWISFIMITVFCLSAGFVSAWPEPSAVSGPGQWTLQVQYEHPRQITVQLPGWDKPRTFWYMILSLTNEQIGQEVPFYPKCELVTDTFKVFPCGQGVNEQVFQLIKDKHRGSYPFLESMDFEDHLIRQGKDNTRDFVIFWPDFDPKANIVRFYVSGLSNESTAIGHPLKKDASGNPELVYLQKTLELTYTMGADPQLRRFTNLYFEGQQWVMR